MARRSGGTSTDTTLGALPGRPRARRRARPQPTYAFLERLRTELQTFYADQDEQIRQSRAQRHLTEQVNLSDDLHLTDIEVRDPTSADEALRTAATMSLDFPTVQVTPVRESDKAQQNATLREHWTVEVLRRAGMAEDTLHAFSGAVGGVVGDGGAWCKLLFLPDLWESRYGINEKDYHDDGEDVPATTRRTAVQKYNNATEDAKKAAGPPFAWLTCDTLSLYPVYEGRTVGAVLEVQQRPRWSCYRQYGLSEDDEGNIVPWEVGQPEAENAGGGSGPTVTFLEYWDDTWRAYAVVNGAGKGYLIEAKRHGYGFLPYCHAFGLLFPEWRNRKVGWGVTETKRWLVSYRSWLLTVHAQVAYRDAIPPFAVETAAGADVALLTQGDDGTPKTGDLKHEKWGARDLIVLPPGRKMGAMPMPPVAQALKEQIALVTELIEKLSAPAMGGNLGGLEASGFAVTSVLAWENARYGPLAHRLEDMLTDLTRKLWKLVRTKVRETVWVHASGKQRGWKGAGPDDLTDDVLVEWTLQREQASAKLLEARYWHERVQAGTASLDQAIEALGDNPDEVRRGKMRDWLRTQTEYLQLLKASVLQEIGAGDLLTNADEAQQIAQTGQVPGLPPVPGAPGQQGGLPNMPDQAALAMSPNGQGVAPMGMPGGGVGPPNGSVPGQLAPPMVPAMSAAPGVPVQRLT